MISKKVFISLAVFSIFMILISAVKTQTRIIEKRIVSHKKEISNLKNNLHLAQLDFHYLSSPDYISKMIEKFSEQQYLTIKYSNIYLSFEEFLEQQEKTKKKFNDKEKIKKK